MTIQTIYDFLNQISPFEMQEKWDNSGLLVGSLDTKIKHIVLSLEIDEYVLKNVKSNTLIITHHPLIFSPLSNITYNTYPSIFLQKMIKNNISHIAMHTNFDKTHLNKFVASNILGFHDITQDDFVVYFETKKIPFKNFAKKIQKKLNLRNINIVKSKKSIQKVALTTGSGASLIKDIKADCFLTGDVKYHDAMMAKALNINLIDITHYHSEKYFCEILLHILTSNQIKAIMINSKNPFTNLRRKNEQTPTATN
jgi:dinuclear metal center YbgI/SA1388 family protein